VAVNDEVGSLRRGLAAGWMVLRAGGRMVVVTFDSLQDRITKGFMRAAARDYEIRGDVDLPEFREPRSPKGRLLTRKAVAPSAAEVAENPRARSAQLRVVEKLDDGEESEK
jgi:16S rRNA (cytosine1402-N4)-methyltransferase